MIITPGELEVGQVLTILKWKPRDVVHASMLFPTTTHTIQDTSYVGDVFTVKAIDLPFVILSRGKDPHNLGPITLNTDLVTLKELSPEFVKEAAQ